MPFKISELLPLVGKNREHYKQFKKYSSKEHLKKIKSLLSKKKVSVLYESLHLQFVDPISIPLLHSIDDSVHTNAVVEQLNQYVRMQAKKSLFATFAPNAQQIICSAIASDNEPKMIRLAAALQLFSTEQLHLLIIGDLGTGKTDVVQSVCGLHHISTFTRGSKITGQDFSLAVKGNEVVKGLLAKADEGIFGVDQLNQMIEKDRNMLISVIDKKYISYAKNDSSFRMDARIRICATATPIGDAFIGKKLELLRKQIPIDKTFISKFHVIFALRRSTKNTKTNQLTDSQREFIKDYVAYAETFQVIFPKEMESRVAEWIKKHKKDEDQFMFSITSNTIIGIIRLAKASARMELRTVVNYSDIEAAYQIMEYSFQSHQLQ